MRTTLTSLLTSLLWATAILFVGGCAYHPIAIPYETALEDTRFTRYTLRGERVGFTTNVFRTNYLADEVVFPAGSEVNFKLFSEGRMDLEVDGIPCELFSPYSPLPRSEEEIDAFLEKHFAETRGDIQIEDLESSTLESIERGAVSVGMSKEEVLLAVGYPAKIDKDIDAEGLSREEILESNQWIYRRKQILWSSRWRVFHFDLEGDLIRTID